MSFVSTWELSSADEMTTAETNHDLGENWNGTPENFIKNPDY